MKPPEEMAEAFAQTIELCCGTSDILIAAENAYLAGYNAAKDDYEAKMKDLKANWTFCCEDKARLLKELAVAEKSNDAARAAADAAAARDAQVAQLLKMLGEK